MAVAVVDTGILIGAAALDDQHHDIAMEIVSGIDHGELPTGRVTNYVLLETLNWVHARKQPETAREFYRRLRQSGGFKIEHAAKTDFTVACELFETYEGLAFGDATTVAYMQREEIEYLYSFDNDFDALDEIRRLDTPINPFDQQ